MILSGAVRRFDITFKINWFGYSILTILSWAGWAILLKLASVRIPAEPLLFLQTIGMAPVAVLLLLSRSGREVRNGRGVLYSLLNGVITGGGILCLMVAYRRGGDVSVATVITSLYPLVTCLLAALFLQERLSRRQKLGMIAATLSIVLFAL